jgi:hypothetical protein
MYPQKRKSRGKGKKPTLRAEGTARAIIRPEKYVNQVVGSEGVLANLASQWQRADPARRWIAPSTDILRSEHVRHLVVVTDLIGSGLRINQFLSLLWDTRSIKSWCSYHKARIWVFAYCATEKGLKMVVDHPSKPTVEVVSACPTIWDQSPRTLRAGIRALCQQYSPVGKNSLGYKDVGALVAFAHGCPNDAPAIFHRSSTTLARPWKALFPGRVTLAAAPKGVPDSLALALDTLGFGSIQNTGAYSRASAQQKKMIVLLCAHSRGRRFWDSMALATGLSLEDIGQSRLFAITQGLLGGDGRLTESGFALLRRLRVAKPLAVKNHALQAQQSRRPLSTGEGNLGSPRYWATYFAALWMSRCLTGDWTIACSASASHWRGWSDPPAADIKSR